MLPPTFTPSLSKTTWLAPEPAVTLSKLTSLAVATVMSLPLRVISMLSPFRNWTVSPALTKEAVSPLACRLKPELLMAFAISPAVTNAFGSVGVPTLPSVAGAKVVVLAVSLPLLSTLMVVPSVFAATV